MFLKIWIKEKAMNFFLGYLRRVFFFPMFSAYGRLSKHEPKPNHLSLVYSVNSR